MQRGDQYIEPDNSYYRPSRDPNEGTMTLVVVITLLFVCLTGVLAAVYFKKATTKVNEHYSYMAKNTYWFDCWENLSYFQEDWPNRQHEIGRKIYLVPSGFKGYEIQEGTIVTTDADDFWAAPGKVSFRGRGNNYFIEVGPTQGLPAAGRPNCRPR